jgi:hypothetical protein
MFKYLKTFRNLHNISQRSFSKKGGLFSSFFGSGKGEEQEVKQDNLKYQNDEGNIEKLEKESRIPDSVNYENNLFDELKEVLKEKVYKHEFEGTNFGFFLEKFGEKIGENRKLLIQQLNELNFEQELKPRLDRLIALGFTYEQVKIMLRKE